MKKLLYSLLIVLLIPFAVRAEDEPNVYSLGANAEDGGNIILFSGTTVNDSHAVMCKLLNGSEEIDKLSVEVDNTGANGSFGGSFFAPETGTYTVSCANYEGGTIVTDEVVVSEMTKVTVTFDTGDGENNEQVQVNVGSVVEKPTPDPTKDNKVFGGWYEDNTYTRTFDFGTRITAHVTIYAKWDDPEEVPTQNQTRVQVIYSGGGTYQVDFDTDDPDNQGPMNAQIDHAANYFVDPNTEVTLTAVPAQGHHLAGWYATHEEDDPNNPGHPIWVEEGLLSSNLEYVFTPTGENVNIKLVFEENTPEAPEEYTVTFDTNGGSNIAPVNIESGELVTRPADPTKDDKVFINWYADETLTHTFDFNTPITADTTIYAAWGYTVTFNTNGGSTINQVKVKEGDKVARPTDPTKVENNITKIFENWYDDENLEHDYNFDDQVNENITLYAKWLQEYSKTDADGNELEFTSDEDKNLQLIVTDLESLTDEQLLALNPMLDRETFNALLESLTEEAKRFGTVISFLDISVYEGQNVVDIDTEVNLKLAITDEMGDYKYYKLVYIDGDANGNIFLGNAYNLTKQGNKLTGRLPHLSTYVLVGSNTSDSNTSSSSSATTKTSKTSKNPVTSDNIYTMFIVFGVSLIGILFGTFRYLKVRKVK